MKSYREELWFHTQSRREYVNITSQVERVVQHSGIQEGLVLVNAMHITASVYVNDDEAGLLQDYERFLEQLVPHAADYNIISRAKIRVRQGIPDTIGRDDFGASQGAKSAHTGSMEAMSDAGAVQKRLGPTGRPIFGPGRRCSSVTSFRDASSSRLAPITNLGLPIVPGIP